MLRHIAQIILLGAMPTALRGHGMLGYPCPRKAVGMAPDHSPRFCAQAMLRMPILIASILFGAAALSAADPPAKDKPAWKSLFDGKTLGSWKAADLGGDGKVHVKDGAIVMDEGKPMTGIVYSKADFPKMDYEVSFEGQKQDGDDFFCTTIFPVGDSHCSLVVGGWGGQVVGLSNVNHENASENETASAKTFEQNKWYKIRLRVTKDHIKAWIGDDSVVDLDTTDRKITLHRACEPIKPFGFATYKTTGAVRAIQVRPLTDAEKKPAATP
jgi:hypothetical protein